MLEPDQPTSFYGDKRENISRFSELTEENPHDSTRRANTTNNNSDTVELGVNHIATLMKETSNGGLHYIYDCCRTDPHLSAPSDCASFIRWLFARSPTMSRALQHLDDLVD